jgi:hypothetical protein
MRAFLTIALLVRSSCALRVAPVTPVAQISRRTLGTALASGALALGVRPGPARAEALAGAWELTETFEGAPPAGAAAAGTLALLKVRVCIFMKPIDSLFPKH